MQVLKKHLFAEPGKELELNTLYSNQSGSCRILKKGNVYEVLIVKKSEEHKIVTAIAQTKAEELALAHEKVRQQLLEETKKLEQIRLKAKALEEKVLETTTEHCKVTTITQAQFNEYNNKGYIFSKSSSGKNVIYKNGEPKGSYEILENGQYKITMC